MLRLFKSFVKLLILSGIILILGNSIHIGGRTVSDQIKTQLSHAESAESVIKIKDWARRATDDAKQAMERKMSEKAGEDIHPSERQKLRALIRELNSAH